MQREFVTYEIALGLKELGFDEECFAIFFRTILNNGRTVNYISDDWESPFYKNRTNSESNSVDIVSAPLWQQVIDWFREKHRISISLIPWDYNTWWYQIETFDTVTNELNSVIAETKKIINGMSYYDNREQAILKAIEIIKSNNIIK